MNHKRVQRIWCEEGLSLPQRRKRRRRTRRAVPLEAKYRNRAWTYHFIHDRTESGGALRILTVEDEYTREGLAVEVDRHLPAHRVKEVLGRLFEEHGQPEYIRSDNGPEFTAHELIEWLGERGVRTYHIEPGSPWQNAYGESFNATLRRECLRGGLFHTLLEARIKIEMWRERYNEERPHSALGYRTPLEFKHGIRIPLLERGRPSSRRGNGARGTQAEKREQVLYFPVVQI